MYSIFRILSETEEIELFRLNFLKQLNRQFKHSKYKIKLYLSQVQHQCRSNQYKMNQMRKPSPNYGMFRCLQIRVCSPMILYS